MKAPRTLALALTIVAMAGGAPAAAAESTSQMIRSLAPPGISTTFYTCIDKAGSDSIAIAACLSSEHQTQDARLNATYKALLGKLQGNAKDALLAAERSWLDLQNKSGNFETTLYGSETVADLQVTQNELFRLCERANTLETYLAVANDQ